LKSVISINVGWQAAQRGNVCGIETFVEMALVPTLRLASMRQLQGSQSANRQVPVGGRGSQPDVLRRCARKNSGWIVFSASTGRPEKPF